MNKLILIFLCILSISCTPNSAGGVRNLEASKKTSFKAHENYQAVYRKILDMSRKCSEGSMITAQMIVKGDLYTDIQTGSISVELHGGFGVNVYHVIDVKALSSDSSEVTTHFALSNHMNHASTIKKWVLENYKECT